METNIKITVPEGYELKWNADHTEVEVVEKKELTYEEISKRLFSNKNFYYTEASGAITKTYTTVKNEIWDLNNATTEIQLKKMLAFNKLMNIATYLNEGWTPDMNYSDEDKYYIYYSIEDKKYYVASNCRYSEGHAYFKTNELAEQAMFIMGDDLKILFKN